jgi:hypothetical protein
MKSGAILSILLALSITTSLGQAGNNSSSDVAGRWKALIVDPATGEVNPSLPRPKTIGEILFVLNREGDTLSGSAKVGAFPGDGVLTNIRIDGSSISFTYTSGDIVINGRATRSVVEFSGKIVGNEMQLDMPFEGKHYRIKGSKMSE